MILATSRYLGGVLGICILGFWMSREASGALLGDHHGALWTFAGSFLLAACVSFLFPGRGQGHSHS